MPSHDMSELESESYPPAAAAAAPSSAPRCDDCGASRPRRPFGFGLAAAARAPFRPFGATSAQTHTAMQNYTDITTPRLNPVLAWHPDAVMTVKVLLESQSLVSPRKLTTTDREKLYRTYKIKSTDE